MKMKWPWQKSRARATQSNTDALRAIAEAEAAKARMSRLDEHIDSNIKALGLEVEKNHFAAALGFRPKEV